MVFKKLLFRIRSGPASETGIKTISVRGAGSYSVFLFIVWAVKIVTLYWYAKYCPAWIQLPEDLLGSLIQFPRLLGLSLE